MILFASASVIARMDVSPALVALARINRTEVMVQSMNAWRLSPSRLILAAIAIVIALGGSAAAEPGYSFATTPGKLPKSVVPTHYAIELEPDLDRLTIAGTEL